MVRDHEEVRYPTLPRTRRSILTTETDDSTIPQIWDIDVKTLKRWDDTQLHEGLQLMKRLYDDYEDLLKSHENMRNKMKDTIDDERADAVNEIIEIATERDTLREELNTAQTTLRTVLSMNSGLLPSVEGDERKQKSTKLPDPPVYKGTAAENFEDWVSKMRDKLNANSDHYPTEEMKMAYFVNRVEGAPSAHLAPRPRINSPQKFQAVEEIFSVLENVYGDHNRRQTALAEYQKLTQANKPFSNFWPDFQRLTAELDMTPLALMDDFKTKISRELKTSIRGLKFVDVWELARTCQEIDRDIQLEAAENARRAYKKTATGPGVAVATKTIVSNPVTTPRTTPARTSVPFSRSRTPLTDEEKQQLQQEGRCYYCKEMGHITNNCPKILAKNTRVAELEVKSGNE